MKILVKVETLRELIRASGVEIKDLAQRLGLNQSTVTLKLAGERPLFLDEIGPITAAINEAGRVEVYNEEVIELVGKSNIKTRGFLRAASK